MLKLLIGNKNYSSWSMRPWVLLKQAGIEFEEVMIPFDSFEAGSRFKTQVLPINPLGKVPVLIDGDLQINDSLSICEYVAETHPGHRLWPEDRAQRASARSACAEMHAGFGQLRNLCGMNIEADLREVGARLLKEHAGLRDEMARIVQLWTASLERSGGPMLFGSFGIADAYFAPVTTRIRTYGLPVTPTVDAYIERLHALPGVRAWLDAARAEHLFVPFDEPYRTSRD